MSSGVYVITSSSGKQYVGSAVNFDKRFREHIGALRKGKHKNCLLQNAWNKYGESNFTFSKIRLCEPEYLLIHEQRFIDKLKPAYNICKIAGNHLGVKRSTKTKIRCRAAQLGKKHSEETKLKMSKARTGHLTSLETRIKLAAQKGWKHSEESKEKMRGRVVSRKTRIKLSKAMKNRSPAHLGIPHTEEIKKIISAKLKGMTRTKESIEKQKRTCALKRNK